MLYADSQPAIGAAIISDLVVYPTGLILITLGTCISDSIHSGYADSLKSPMCRSELFPALSDASSTRGMEERLGLLELYALQHDLSERDEGFRAELRVFLQERRERAAAQDAREFEGYQEPEVEDPESDDDDDAAGIGWYREQHRRLYLTNDEQTDEILDEALGDGLIDETLEEDGWTSEESELPQ